MKEENVNSIVEKAEEAIKVLAGKMGTANEAFWPTFVRKHILDAVVEFIWLVVWGCLAIFLVPKLLTWPHATKLDQYGTDWMLSGMRGLGIVISVCAMASLYSAIEQIKYLGNLRYWALKDYMKTLGKIIPSK